MRSPAARAIARIVVAASLLFVSSAVPALAAQDSPAGIWVGTAQVGAQPVPFRLEISGAGDRVRGALLNGRERSVSSSGSYADGHLVLNFDYYANTLDATIQNGILTGTFAGHIHGIAITAQRDGKLPVAAPHPPRVAGLWTIAVDNGAKGEAAWKLRIRQTGPNVVAVIERIDGDTGSLYGIWRDGAFAVSHFTAAGPSFVVLRPLPDGTLQLETTAHGGGVRTFAAHRATGLRTVALAGTDDPLHHTFLKNPGAHLGFRFPDLSGKLVSSTDPEFAHKALIVSIGGSWCPNCQDEAPFLESLYRRYHGRGLTIVELSFEEASQRQNPVRLRAVIRRYGITYPVLLAGTPDKLAATFPQVANLNCWPTTFFIGRDGRVTAIHTGYEGPATGGDNRQLEAEMTAQVEQLLAARTPPARGSTVQVARVR
ncbi:MAG TPA: TlpA disulfide reductase family protein [Acidobacteriaceae bacterium]|jgi:thiol-disulfide isomerase/thioredoxin|nr:TlpA disulfide reductase family protein [Acidobacteriaceae bacterium]